MSAGRADRVAYTAPPIRTAWSASDVAPLPNSFFFSVLRFVSSSLSSTRPPVFCATRPGWTTRGSHGEFRGGRATRLDGTPPRRVAGGGPREGGLPLGDVPAGHGAGDAEALRRNEDLEEVTAAPRRPVVAHRQGVGDQVPGILAADGVDFHTAGRVAAGARAVAVRRERGGRIRHRIGG